MAQYRNPSTENLRARTLSVTWWVVARMGIVTVLRVASIAVLARWIDRESFGQAAIVGFTLMLCEILSQSGIDVALVRERGDVGPLLNASFSFQCCRGIALASILGALAIPIASYQRDSMLASLLCVAALTPIIDGLHSPGPTLLGRGLEQKRLSILEIIITALGVGIGIGIAAVERSAWAIVWSGVAFSFIRTIGSYVVHPVRVRFTREWGALRPLLRFGVFFNLAGCMGCLAQNIDRFIIGRGLGLDMLGAYDRCFRLSTYPVSQLPKLSAGTAYPSLSAVIGEPERLRRNSRRFLVVIGAGCISLALILFVGAGPIVTTVLGEGYRDTVPIFRLMAMLTVTRGFALGFDVLIDVHGQPNRRFYASCLEVVLLTTGTLTGLHYGALSGATAGVVGASLLTTGARGFLAFGLHRELGRRIAASAARSSVAAGTSS